MLLNPLVSFLSRTHLTIKSGGHCPERHNIRDGGSNTGNSFNFFARQYDGTGSSTVDVCKPSFMFLTLSFISQTCCIVWQSGEIIVNEGVGAEEPNLPVPDDTMKLCSLFLPSLALRPKDVEIKREKNQRFTMRDIAELETELTT